MSDNLHLDIDKRKVIELELGRNTTFAEIAKIINKDPTSISKEIRKHRIKIDSRKPFVNENKCARRFFCHRKNICNTKCRKECRTCNKCNSVCKDYVDSTCIKLLRAPYVCNGCDFYSKCKTEKYLYKANTAQIQYETTLVESRLGINISDSELDTLNKIVSEGIKHGQSLSHIQRTMDLSCSRATLYKYIHTRALNVIPLDMPRMVRLKPRKKAEKSESKETNARKRRTYEDFIKYCALNPEASIVEMDTVEGIKGGKVFLTLFFRNSKLMLIFLLNSKTQNEVENVFNFLQKKLTLSVFKKLFSVILTDNGTEFGNPSKLEFDINGNPRTRIFYCDPRASYQKGMIEKNHEFIRYVLPKGSSFNNLTQDDANLLMNHINSYARECLNWATPIDLAKLYLGKKTIKKLNLKKVPACEIQLNKKLLKKI
ncbi:MAG: IS30 family transposase [Treponema sp.]|nr:IS30 family transposase [Treponema sp.]